MEKHVLYAAEELDRAKATQKRIAAAMAVTGGLGLVLCVLFCCFATRKNQDVTLPLTIGTSVLFGWIVIFLSHSRYDGARALVRHLELMLTGPRERFSGRFTKLDGVYRVKRGVSIRKVRHEVDHREILLTVADEKSALLPESFEGTVETVYDCIVAYEEAENASREVSE